MGASSSVSLASEITKALVAELRASGVSSVTILRTADAPLTNDTETADVSVLTHDPTSGDQAPVRSFKGDFVPYLNRSLVESDFVIVIGELKPHCFLGTAGLPDVIFPGSASADSLRSHLSDRKGLTMDALHKERLEIVNAIPNHLAIGFVLDSQESVAGIACGKIAEVAKDLEEPLKAIYSTVVERPADIVILSAGGKPTDQSLLRAVDTLPCGLAASKPHGSLIVAAECPQGHGGTEFYDWSVEKKEPRYLEARLRNTFSYNGFKAAFLARTLETHKVYLVSTIPDHYVEGVFGMRPAATVNSALQAAQRTQGSDSTISVIPNASRIALSQTRPEKS
jgi:nickel-dependent lactate racemase